jgi:hypothetical protein
VFSFSKFFPFISITSFTFTFQPTVLLRSCRTSISVTSNERHGIQSKKFSDFSVNEFSVRANKFAKSKQSSYNWSSFWNWGDQNHSKSALFFWGKVPSFVYTCQKCPFHQMPPTNFNVHPTPLICIL